MILESIRNCITKFSSCCQSHRVHLRDSGDWIWSAIRSQCLNLDTINSQLISPWTFNFTARAAALFWASSGIQILDFLYSVSFNSSDNLFCTDEASLSSPKCKRAVQSDLTSSLKPINQKLIICSNSTAIAANLCMNIFLRTVHTKPLQGPSLRKGFLLWG